MKENMNLRVPDDPFLHTPLIPFLYLIKEPKKVYKKRVFISTQLKR